MQKPDAAQLDKIKGGIIGFMIGDALGLPAAGIPKQDVLSTLGKITTYTENPSHPFLSFLKKGQYGGNSRLMLAVLQSLLMNKKYDLKDVLQRLKSIARKSTDDAVFSRWMGVTIRKSLMSGIPSNSDSFTCIYGTIPLIMLMNDKENVLKKALQQSRATHISPISLSATAIMAHILLDLKNLPGKDLKDTVSQAVLEAEQVWGQSLLTENIRHILAGKIQSVEHARMVFGTGSRANQAIPLAVYIVLNNQGNFKRGLLSAVNSFREDSGEEAANLKSLPYEKALIHCRGGDTNAVGGLVGLMLGMMGGYKRIPEEYKKGLEDGDFIASQLDQYITS